MIPRIGGDSSYDVRVDRDELRESWVWTFVVQILSATISNPAVAERKPSDSVLTEESIKLARALVAELEREGK